MGSEAAVYKSPEGVYFVERVCGRRILKRKVQYWIKWQGYGEQDCTWEPAIELHGCKALIAAYNTAHPPYESKERAPKSDSPKRKRTPIHLNGQKKQLQIPKLRQNSASNSATSRSSVNLDVNQYGPVSPSKCIVSLVDPPLAFASRTLTKTALCKPILDIRQGSEVLLTLDDRDVNETVATFTERQKFEVLAAELRLMKMRRLAPTVERVAILTYERTPFGLEINAVLVVADKILGHVFQKFPLHHVQQILPDMLQKFYQDYIFTGSEVLLEK